MSSTGSTAAPTPFHRRPDYIRAVLELYLALPHTPRRPRPDDRFFARQLLHRGVPLLVVEAALLLASARRLSREPNDPLPPIRSLRYFTYAVEEIQEELRFRMDYSSLVAYANYLRAKVPLSPPPPPTARACSSPAKRAKGSRPPVQLRFNW
jgi:hypothetical protein